VSGSPQELRRRREARRESERRRRAGRRRRFALAAVALISLGVGVAVGAGHETGGGGESSATGGKAAKPSPGGQGPPASDVKLVHSQDPVPVLMYHVIADAPSGAALPELYVDPKSFEAEVRWLEDQGYTAVSLDQVYDAWFKNGEIPEKPVVLSFDDGYRGQYVYARPLLRELGWPAVLNLKVNTLDAGGELTQQMVQQMINAGWELDSHTINHLDVSTLSGATLQHEVAGSRQILQQRFNQPVDFFCYPAGKFDAESIKAVQDAGYLGATTVEEGLASKDEMFTLKRIRVDGSDGVNGLSEKLREAGA
jgi:peptidoglycan/xylan/chitin deacetylase (PgdA/CDA1 family)